MNPVTRLVKPSPVMNVEILLILEVILLINLMSIIITIMIHQVQHLLDKQAGFVPTAWVRDPPPRFKNIVL